MNLLSSLFNPVNFSPMHEDYSYFLNKAQHYCDFQERSYNEVVQKLKSWKLREEIIEKIIQQLEHDDFINEDRFVRAYAIGKLRYNHWGRNKIIMGLRAKGIPDLMIQIGLQEIDGEEYLEVLKKVLHSKTINEKDPWKKQAKLAQYAIQKGFQPSLVWEMIKDDAD